MSTWVGFFEQSREKSEMVFKFASIDENTGEFRAEGKDRCGSFHYRGLIKGNLFKAVKHYSSWNIHYSGNYNQEKHEISGFWGWHDGQECETFKIMKIKNEYIRSFRQTLEDLRAFSDYY